MTESYLPTVLSGAQSTFNLLKEWRESKNTEKSHYQQADSIMQDNADELREMKRQNAQERGQNIAKAGASGVALSSFNDALLSEDLKNAREMYDKQKKAREEAWALRKLAKKERRNRREKAFSYSVGLLSDFSGLGG